MPSNSASQVTRLHINRPLDGHHVIPPRQNSNVPTPGPGDQTFNQIPGRADDNGLIAASPQGGSTLFLTLTRTQFLYRAMYSRQDLDYRKIFISVRKSGGQRGGGRETFASPLRMFHYTCLRSSYQGKTFGGYITENLR